MVWEAVVVEGVHRRKVLIIEDEPSIRDVLYVVLAGMGCETDIASSGQQALAMIGRESFDALLLDLRCANLATERMVTEINQLQPSLMGRVLVITGEVSTPEVLETIERFCLPHLPASRVLSDLWALLRPLLGLSRRPRTAT